MAPERLTFGEVYETNEFRWVLPIENRGSTECRIIEFVNSCSCGQITPRSAVVAPGEVREFTLTLNLTARGANASGSSVRAFEADVIPLIEGLTSRGLAWKVRGTVRSVLRVDATDLDFGRRSEDAKAFASKKVKLTALRSVGRVIARSSSSHLVVSISRQQADTAQFELCVEERGAQPVGSFESEITIVPETAEGEELGRKVILVRGTIVPDLDVTPSAVMFGGRMHGDQCEENVTVESLTGQTLRLKEVRAEGDGLAVDAATPSSANRIELLVKQNIVADGAGHGKILLVVERQDGTARTLVVDVGYSGVSK